MEEPLLKSTSLFPDKIPLPSGHTASLAFDPHSPRSSILTDHMRYAGMTGSLAQTSSNPGSTGAGGQPTWYQFSPLTSSMSSSDDSVKLGNGRFADEHHLSALGCHEASRHDPSFDDASVFVRSSSDSYSTSTAAAAAARRYYQTGVNTSPMYSYSTQLPPQSSHAVQSYASTQKAYSPPAFGSGGGQQDNNCLCRMMGQSVCTCGVQSGLSRTPRASIFGASMSGGSGMGAASPTMLQIQQQHQQQQHQHQEQQQQQQQLGGRHGHTGVSTPHMFTSMSGQPTPRHTSSSGAGSVASMTYSNHSTSSPHDSVTTPSGNAHPHLYDYHGTTSSSSTAYALASKTAGMRHGNGGGLNGGFWSSHPNSTPPTQTTFAWNAPESRPDVPLFSHSMPSTMMGGGDVGAMDVTERTDAFSSAKDLSPINVSLMLSDEDGGNTARYANEEDRWNAIVDRSHSADSHFVYGALTTRIYCRPSCASKRPDRSRVHYFMFPDAAVKAERAGFRACKRCKPGTQGTADLCVLAVGGCLRHMTRAALLGESDEVDKRLKRRTLKQYSSDFGVSAFHFHRTLKAVCTLTPGEYTKATHSLVLQDEIGMDRNGRLLEPDELNRKLRGWSTRRARRALGNVLPHAYAAGLPDMQVHYILADGTPFGRVVVVHTLGRPSHTRSHALAYAGLHATAIDMAGEECNTPAVLAVLLGDDAVQRATMRFPRAMRDDERSGWLHRLTVSLKAKGTREVQMPREITPWVRRARIYLAAKRALEPQSRGLTRKGPNNLASGFGDDGSFYDDDDE